MAVYGIQRIFTATSVSKSNGQISLCAVKSDDEGMTKGWKERKAFAAFG